MFEIEPELNHMDYEIRNMPLKQRCSANEWWYGLFGFRKRMDRFVGLDARKKKLRSMEYHKTMHSHLYDLIHKRCSSPNRDLRYFATSEYDPRKDSFMR